MKEASEKGMIIDVQNKTNDKGDVIVETVTGKYDPDLKRLFHNIQTSVSAEEQKHKSENAKSTLLEKVYGNDSKAEYLIPVPCKDSKQASVVDSFEEFLQPASQKSQYKTLSNDDGDLELDQAMLLCCLILL